MATEYYSTQASVQARIGLTRLTNLTDFSGDDAPDTETLEAGFQEARGIIRGKLEPLYGSTEIDTWDSDTAPELVRTISDQLCVKMFYVGNPHFEGAEAAQEIYDNAMELLDKVASGEITLYGVAGVIDGVFVVDRIPSDFDNNRLPEDMTVNPNWILPDPRDLDG
jgi:phage gp36-like protein